MTQGLRRRGVAGLAILVLATLMVLVPALEAAAAVFPPRFQRSIGGSGRPGVFAWGTCFSRCTDRIYVTDYLNFQIRVYDLNGNPQGDFYRADQDGQPYSCAVSPIDGSIYVAELKDNPYSNRIAKYDANGVFQYEIGPHRSPAPVLGVDHGRRRGQPLGRSTATTGTPSMIHRRSRSTSRTTPHTGDEP